MLFSTVQNSLFSNPLVIFFRLVTYQTVPSACKLVADQESPNESLPVTEHNLSSAAEVALIGICGTEHEPHLQPD